MAQDVWKAGADVYALMNECIKRHLPDLLDISDKIEIVFKEKASTPQGRVIAGKTRRAPALLKVLADNESIFIIEIGADIWQQYGADDRAALLTHHLCSISVKENAQTGERSYGIAPPDFIGYKKEIELYGVWRYLNVEDEEDEENVIDKLFGPDAPWNKDDE